ncbi:cytochrome c [Carboxylicivirga sp. A043]|uniref:c-type cytochrome n=1 Tax=Carboxylicivirga litoralis TaxID=2816963 RepID=UPI0021CB1DA8|nr:cytochrome c [Carboxylicivirga sp. A043]MCU4154513.1 cytochrome c [Carboxylicivirga sp. A043]
MHKIIIVIVFIMGLVACGSPQKKHVEQKTVESTGLANQNGKLVYKRHCLACHQANAGGIPKMYPPLAKNKVISGEKEQLIGIVLNGMSGEIEVNGETYNGVMAGYRNLSDKDIADVLNYLRAGFGNTGDIITEDEVKMLR